MAGSRELRYRRDRRFELFGVDISAMTVDVLSLLPADVPLIFVAQEFWAVARCALAHACTTLDPSHARACAAAAQARSDAAGAEDVRRVPRRQLHAQARCACARHVTPYSRRYTAGIFRPPMPRCLQRTVGFGVRPTGVGAEVGNPTTDSLGCAWLCTNAVSFDSRG